MTPNRDNRPRRIAMSEAEARDREDRLNERQGARYDDERIVDGLADDDLMPGFAEATAGMAARAMRRLAEQEGEAAVRASMRSCHAIRDAEDGSAQEGSP